MRFLLLPALLAASPVLAAPAGSPLMRALTDEMSRTVKRLEMESLGKPYFVSYTARDTRRLELESSFGALKNPHEYRSRRLKIDLRVGKPAFDNTHYVGKDYWRFSPFTGSLVRGDDYDAIRYGVWSLTDKAYKHALQKLAQKNAYKQNKLIKEEIPDLSKEKVRSSAVLPSDLPFDRALWEKRVRRLSAVFRRYPAVQDSQVNLYWTQVHTTFVDSEGRRIVKTDHDFEILMAAATQAPDGMRLSDVRRVIRQSIKDMPPFSSLETEAVLLAQQLTDLVEAPKWEKTYIGPVLFEGQAAGEFFNQLLARNVSFSREVWVENEHVKKEFHSGSFPSRLGLRVVSPLLSVTDDPTLKTFEGTPLIGHYGVDDEGIPAVKVPLVEKGILKDVLMSRSPVKERKRSNGHGRAAFNEFTTARIGNLVVEAHKTATIAQMRRELRKQARAYGLKYGLVVTRLGEEDDQEGDEKLAAPIVLRKVYVKNGRMELVRNASFTGVTLRALRDVVMASKKRDVYNYYQLGPYTYSRGQVQASIVHPSVLISEMELKKSEKKPDRLPYLKHPSFN